MGKRLSRDRFLEKDAIEKENLLAVLEGVGSLAEIRDFVRKNLPGVDQPGRSYYSNLIAFLDHRIMPGGASEEECRAYQEVAKRIFAL